jgi:soluble lytic murein transglycosylase
MLSAEAIGQRQETVSAPIEADVAALATFGAGAAVRRAVKLAQLDMRPESQREWLYVVRGLPDEALLVAAEYARREGLYDRAINTADRTVHHHNYKVRYLAPFKEVFNVYARSSGLEVAWVLGLVRQESPVTSWPRSPSIQ